MDLEIYKYDFKNIIKIEKIDPKFLIIVKNNKKKSIYIWRSRYIYSNPNYYYNFNEIKSHVKNFFQEIDDIYLLNSIKPSNNDSEDIKEIKNFIYSRIDDQKILKNIIKNKIGILNKIKNEFKVFNKIRNKSIFNNNLLQIKNLKQLRKASFYNILIIGTVSIILSYFLVNNILEENFSFITESNFINPVLWKSWLMLIKIVFIICICAFSYLFIYNLLYILFPLHFSIKLFRFSLEDRKYGLNIEEILDILSKQEIKKEEINLPKHPISVELEGNLNEFKKITKVLKKLTPEIEYESEEAKDLSIPEVPLPKKKESTITSNQIINNELLNIESETIDKKIILAYCDICKKTLQIKLNKNIILQSDLPLIEISYIHGDPIHALNFQVDKAFSVRRTRVCSALFENE